MRVWEYKLGGKQHFDPAVRAYPTRPISSQDLGSRPRDPVTPSKIVLEIGSPARVANRAVAVNKVLNSLTARFKILKILLLAPATGLLFSNGRKYAKSTIGE